MARFTRPEDERPPLTGGVDDVRIARRQARLIRSEDDARAADEARREYEERARELLETYRWQTNLDALVDLFARLLANSDMHGWYYGPLTALKSVDPTARAGHMRETWALLGELVGAGVLEVAFLARWSLGAQRAGFERPTVTDREALRRANGGSHTREQWDGLQADMDWQCVKCGRPHEDAALTKDHIVPVSQGGSDSIDNLQPLCASCNSAKGTTAADYRLDPAPHQRAPRDIQDSSD